MCFVWLSEETVPFALDIINRLVFITEAESVYCMLQTEYFYNRYVLYQGGFPLRVFIPFVHVIVLMTSGKSIKK